VHCTECSWCYIHFTGYRLVPFPSLVARRPLRDSNIRNQPAILTVLDNALGVINGRDDLRLPRDDTWWHVINDAPPCAPPPALC
jgi:hypothetical protein